MIPAMMSLAIRPCWHLSVIIQTVGGVVYHRPDELFGTTPLEVARRTPLELSWTV